jgi:hypothetical protein
MANESTHSQQPEQDTPEIANMRAELAYHAALSLATTGQYDAAESLLQGAAAVLSSSQAKDLLARLAAQRGDLTRAEQLWTEIATDDPEFQPARKALSHLRSGWFRRAVAIRLSYLVGIAAFISLATIGTFAVISGSVKSCYSKCERPTVPAIAPLPGTLSIPVGPGRSVHKQGLSLSIPGCIVSTNAAALTVVFPDGLFSARCTLTESARQLLREVATALRTLPGDYLITVEGHTDSAPPAATNKYGDHYYLGFCRALMVADALMTEQSIGPDRIVLTTAGPENPPFPGVDAATKMKNRTVVLRIQQLHNATNRFAFVCDR